MADEHDSVGIAEIAERAGVKEITVRKWRIRHDHTSATPFPASVGTVSGRPTWSWGDVERWLRETGRRP